MPRKAPGAIDGRTVRFGSLAERLARLVDKSGGPDACWPFLGHRNPDYGTIRQGGINGGRKIGAHVAAFLIANDLDEMPDGLWVLHSCDNPPCCNPAHLFSGSPSENRVDASVKGRLPPQHGELNNFAKLTEAHVIQIILEPDANSDEIGARYGVSRGVINQIRRGETWKHVPRLHEETI